MLPQDGNLRALGAAGGGPGRRLSGLRGPSPLAAAQAAREGRVVKELEAQTLLGGVVAARQPLHEVDLALMLPRLGALARSALASEGHVPALVLGVLQGRVVVLQHDLREDTILAFAVALQVGGPDMALLGSVRSAAPIRSRGQAAPDSRWAPQQMAGWAGAAAPPPARAPVL